MSLNFPADPVANPTYEAPNGVTYIWNDSIQSWVVQSVTYDDDYVNRTGDTMTGNLNFASASSPIGLNWGANPKLVFVSGGNTELRGNYVVTGGFTFSSSGINFNNADSILKFKNSRRLVFTADHTHISYGGTMYLSLTANGVQYHGHFTQPKNITTVEYVASEIGKLEAVVEDLSDNLEDTIVDVVNDKAVLLQGSQDINGTKKFKKQILIDRGEDVGNNAVNSFIIKGNVGSPNKTYNVLLKDYRRKLSDSTRDSIMYYGAVSSSKDIVNKEYVDNNFLKDVIGTANEPVDTGVRTTEDGNTKKIYMEKATISQYGVNVRGLLPQGNNDPDNASLQVGQMYFNKNTKRVLIRVN